MPYRDKKSPYYFASFTDASGKRVRRSTGTADRKEAEAIEANWKQEAFRLQKWGKQPDRTFDEVILAYMDAT